MERSAQLGREHEVEDGLQPSRVRRDDHVVHVGPVVSRVVGIARVAGLRRRDLIPVDQVAHGRGARGLGVIHVGPGVGAVELVLLFEKAGVQGRAARPRREQAEQRDERERHDEYESTEGPGHVDGPWRGSSPASLPPTGLTGR